MQIAVTLADPARSAPTRHPRLRHLKPRAQRHGEPRYRVRSSERLRGPQAFGNILQHQGADPLRLAPRLLGSGSGESLVQTRKLTAKALELRWRSRLGREQSIELVLGAKLTHAYGMID